MSASLGLRRRNDAARPAADRHPCSVRCHVAVMPLAAHGTPVSIREMVRLRYSENPAEQGAGFWKSRRLVLVVMLKVPGMRAIGLFARGGLDRRRAVVVAARSLAVALAIVLLAGEAAWADCTPAAADNVTATCTGATTNQGGGLPGSTTGNDGYGTGVETGVTVNVVGGASNTVSGNTSGIFLGDATVTNNAGASITGGQFGILANSGAANVINSGSITGISGVGIRAQSDANVTNNAGASIAGVVGIVANAGGSSVFNAGNIIGDTVAIQFAGNGNTLTLAPTSQIFGLVLGTGSDIFQLGGTGAATFNVSSFSGPGGGYLGFGTFNKIDSSVWTLTGTNTAALPWSVNAGTLMVNGTIANSPMTVNTGGTLAGTGTVGNVTVETGGAFSPGSGAPGSTMAVSGNLAFQSGAFYLVQLNPAASSFASVTGTATLGGATVNASFAAGTFVAKQYAIVHATGGVTGTFGSQVNTNLPAGFKSSLSYDGNDAYLNLALSFIPPSSPNFGGGLNGNQARVGTALVNFFNSTSGIPMVFGSLSPAGLTQASGETVTGSQQTTFDAMNQFMGVMTDPFVAGRGEGGSVGGGATGYADGLALGYAQPRKPNDALAAITTKAPRFVPFTPGWSVWAAGFGGSQTTDGSVAAGSNNTTSSLSGTAVGADYRLSPDTLAGFALAGGGINFSVTGSGSGRSDLFQAGAFVRHNVGAAYISAALAYGWQDITTNRTISIAGTDMLRAEFNANAYSGRVEGGYRFVTPWMGITPYAAGQFTTFDLPAYAERALSGASTFALAYGAKSVTDPRSELGLRSDRSFALPDAVLTLRGRAAWAHDYDLNRSIGATFQTLPGASFVVNGAAQASDSALVTASVEMKWMNGWSAAATFEGEFSDVTESYAGKGIVRYAW